jgi:transcriptional regulator with PAS, ATPase and Fis domain
MKPFEEFVRIKASLEAIAPCSSFEATIIHAFIVLERNDGNRTQTSKDLKIAIRTLRSWIQIMDVWGLPVPEARWGVRKKKKKSG